MNAKNIIARSKIQSFDFFELTYANNDIPDSYQLKKEFARFCIFIKGDILRANIICDKIIADNSHSPLWVYYYSSHNFNYTIAIGDAVQYTPIPKNGSTSIKKFCADLTGVITTNKSPHSIFGNPFFSTESNVSNSILDSIVIVRDPIDRFVSYYNKNILNESSLIKEANSFCNRNDISIEDYNIDLKPTFEYFVENWNIYCFIFNDVLHHLLPQKAYISDLRMYKYIYGMTDLDQAVNTIREKVKGQYPIKKAPKEMVSKQKNKISNEHYAFLATIYNDDIKMLAGDSNYSTNFYLN